MQLGNNTVRRIKLQSNQPIIYYVYLGIDGYFIIGSLLYLVLMKFPRKILAKNHIKGIRYYKAKKYKEAIYEFEKSYQYFQQHQWIDKYRAIILFSGSSISYTEMALINIAFCYGQIGEGLRSEETYKKVLDKYPNNEAAKSALRMLMSAKNLD